MKISTSILLPNNLLTFITLYLNIYILNIQYSKHKTVEVLLNQIWLLSKKIVFCIISNKYLLNNFQNTLTWSNTFQVNSIWQIYTFLQSFSVVLCATVYDSMSRFA